MNKFHKIYFFYFIIFMTLFFYSCERKHSQTNKLSQDIVPAEYDKIEVKLGNRSYKVSLNYKIEKQSTHERKFVKINKNHLFKIGGVQDTTFVYPMFIRTDRSENIYVLDQGYCCAKVFNSEGVFLRKYGSKGRGPGEFVTPFRMDISSDGKVLVSDINSNKCELFWGNKTRQFKTPISSASVCFVDLVSFITLQNDNPFDYSAITRYNMEDGNTHECQNLIITKSGVNMGPLPFLEGDVFKVDKGGFVYVPMYMNHFVRYSSQGRIIFARNTIDNIELPSIQRNDASFVSYVLPDKYISSWRAFVVGDKLYNVSYQATKKTKIGKVYVIDVYLLDNGKYLFSFRLNVDKKIINIYMDKERIYLLDDSSELEVLSYKISE